MTTNHWHDAHRIFQDALDREAAERSAFVLDACHGDQGLRREVETLLAAHTQAGDFLQSPGPGITSAEEEVSAVIEPGTSFGPYQVVEQIGSGDVFVPPLARYRTDALAALKQSRAWDVEYDQPAVHE